MRIGLLEGVQGLSDYTGEILSLWGVLNVSRLTPGQLAGLDPAQIPVLVLPTGADGETKVTEAVLDYARRGGAVLSCLPGPTLARAAGIHIDGDREGPQRLRLTRTPMAGLAGESLVVVGRSQAWSLPDNEPATVTLSSQAKPPPPTDAMLWAVLYPAGQDAGEEAPGVVQRQVGAGTIMAIAFDLPLAVLLLRQGDPHHTESGGRPDGPARPAHLACDVGPQEPDSIPYADLLGRLLVEWVSDLFPSPLPHLWHLPDGAPGIVVYSGDEDGAEVEWNQQQFAEMTEAGGRMNLYMIPGNTHSTPGDVTAYQQHHDVGPHPNIRSHDGAPVAARVEEMVRQIQQFEEMFGTPARSLRNHCIAWAGYLEPVRAMANHGVGMEGNYFCSTFLRDRGYAPYAAFGAAMPLRFGYPDGEMLSVRQQHTHTMDDVYFGPEYVSYSYAMSADLWEMVLARVLDDVVERFHVPHATCIHPSNWVRFSRNQGLALVRQAVERQLPVWSFDQWLGFLEAREAWHCESVRWEGDSLYAVYSGGSGPCSFVMPKQWRGRDLVALEVEGGQVTGTAHRYGRPVEIIRHVDGPRLQLRATYLEGLVA